MNKTEDAMGRCRMLARRLRRAVGYENENADDAEAVEACLGFLAGDVLLLAEKVGLLLDCLRNLVRSEQRVDLDIASAIALEVEGLLATVRAQLPRPE